MVTFFPTFFSSPAERNNNEINKLIPIWTIPTLWSHEEIMIVFGRTPMKHTAVSWNSAFAILPPTRQNDVHAAKIWSNTFRFPRAPLSFKIRNQAFQSTVIIKKFNKHNFRHHFEWFLSLTSLSDPFTVTVYNLNLVQANNSKALSTPQNSGTVKWCWFTKLEQTPPNHYALLTNDHLTTSLTSSSLHST